MLSVILAIVLQAPIVQKPVLLWDCPPDVIQTDAVIRYEVQVNDSAPFDAGLPANGSGTCAAPLPPLTAGEHRVRVRGCSADLCGDYSATVTFKLAIIPRAPSNPRIGGGS